MSFDTDPGRRPRNTYDSPSERFPLPMRTQLLADEQAKFVWAAIELLPESSKHLVHDVLSVWMAVPNHRNSAHDVRVAQAVAALREAARILAEEQAASDEHHEGHESTYLSVENFKRLRLEHDEAGWPPASSITRWMGEGSWHGALREAGLYAPANGDHLAVVAEAAFTEGQAVRALAACITELGFAPPFTGYLRWAARPDVQARVDDVPLSSAPFVRLFGSWTQAVQVALDYLEDDRPLSEAPLAVRTVQWRYGAKELRGALREVARRLGRSPRRVEYRRIRMEMMREDRARGGAQPARPSLAAYYAAYRDWNTALEDADLEPRRAPCVSVEALEYEFSARQYTVREHVEVLRTVKDALGPDPMRKRAFEVWRHAQPDPTLYPHADTILKRFELGWRDLLDIALSPDLTVEQATDRLREFAVDRVITVPQPGQADEG